MYNFSLRERDYIKYKVIFRSIALLFYKCKCAGQFVIVNLSFLELLDILKWLASNCGVTFLVKIFSSQFFINLCLICRTKNNYLFQTLFESTLLFLFVCAYQSFTLGSGSNLCNFMFDFDPK